MLQADTPSDYVIGTGEAHTVREFCELAFGLVDLDWEQFVRVDPSYFRPTDVEFLQADPSRAASELGWVPTTRFEELVSLMVIEDLRKVGLDLESRRAVPALQIIDLSDHGL